MQLDTNAFVTIIPKIVRTDVLGAKSLLKTDVKLCSYSDHEVSVIGEATVHVSYGDQEAYLSVIVTAGDGPALMGRNWLSVLKLDWKQIREMSLEPVDKIEKLVSN